MAAPDDPHHSAMASLYLKADFSDMVIRCDGEDLPIHQAVVCSTSPVLERLCKIEMRESKEKVIEHVVFDVATVKRMLGFIYKRAYFVEESCFALTKHCGINPEGFTEVVHQVYKYTSQDETDLRDVLRYTVLDNADELCSDSAFMAGLSEGEELQRFAAEMVKCVATSRREVEEEVAMLRRDGDKKAEKYEQNMEKHKQEMALEEARTSGLIEQITDLPTFCRSAVCGQRFSKFTVTKERNANGYRARLLCG